MVLATLVWWLYDSPFLLIVHHLDITEITPWGASEAKCQMV